MPTVLVTDQINESALPILEEVATVVYKPKLSQSELEAIIGDFDALMLRSASSVTAETFAKAPNLRIVGRAGVGTDNIDIAAANRHGCIVVNSPEGNTIAASEHTLAMLLASARFVAEGDASLKQGKWERKRLTGTEVFGKTLGLIGLGKIGSRVAKVAHALGMKLLVFDPYVAATVIEALNAKRATLDEIWAKADVITLHVPKTPETKHMINAEVLKQCKKGVRFVNCARGGLIDETALAEAIKSGHVAGAALDVFDQEPLQADSPLLSLGEKVLLTPHLGASTEEAQVNVALDVAEQIRDFFKYGTARSAVNMPLLRSDVLDPVRPYMPMCEMLGSFVRQLATGASKKVEVITKGAGFADLNIKPLTLAVLKGIFSYNREGVTFVNVLLLAEERDIDLQEAKQKSAGSYNNQITVVLTTEEGEFRVSGTLLGLNTFRITQVQNFTASLEPTPYILLAPHEDKPGMVANVASVLGQEGINIRALQVGRESTAGESIMLFNLDNEPSQQVVQAMAKLSGVTSAKLIRLSL
jgi:D-3-phosphoglycerate dehydrogenase / 2-oxoglutarate reductase